MEQELDVNLSDMLDAIARRIAEIYHMSDAGTHAAMHQLSFYNAEIEIRILQRETGLEWAGVNGSLADCQSRLTERPSRGEKLKQPKHSGCFFAPLRDEKPLYKNELSVIFLREFNGAFSIRCVYGF